MTREQFIKTKIAEKGFSVKSFSEHINMPYSTLLSILKSSIGGASVDNVIKICKGLDITIDSLSTYEDETDAPMLSDKERTVILAYRSQPAMQPAVDRLLGVSSPAGASLIADTVASDLAAEAALLQKKPASK